MGSEWLCVSQMQSLHLQAASLKSPLFTVCLNIMRLMDMGGISVDKPCTITLLKTQCCVSAGITISRQLAVKINSRKSACT